MTIEYIRIGLDIITLAACAVVYNGMVDKLAMLAKEVGEADAHNTVQYGDIVGRVAEIRTQLPKKRNRKTNKQETTTNG